MATWTTKVDNVDNVAAADVNNLQTEKIDRDGQIPLTGVLQWDKGADVTSANPLVLGKDGNYFDVTGTAGIAGINSDAFGGTTAVQAGTVIKLHFDGACLLTHSANFYLPGAENYTTVAGDELEFTCFGSDTWRCTCIKGQALAPASGPTFNHVHLAGAAMQSESSGTVGALNYATDAGREAVGGQALEAIVKSAGSATYHRMILDNRQDCVVMNEIISYTP